MIARTQKGGLQVANALIELVANKITPGIDVEPDTFWAAFEASLEELGPKNQALLRKRETLQTQIDDWHLEYKGQEHDAVAYKQMLLHIGYLVPEGGEFKITTTNVDPEIAITAGAQLVVPTSNARFALTPLMRDGAVFTMLSMVQMLLMRKEGRRGVVVITQFGVPP